VQLACRIVYSIFSSDCVCEYGICGRTGTPLKILTALQVLSLPKRHKQVVSTNWAKYHQTGQADTRWKPVWKWRERDAKLCHEAAAFKAVPFENHPITVSSADYSKKKTKVWVCQVSICISHRFDVPQIINSDFTSGSAAVANMRSSSGQTMEEKVRSKFHFARSETF